MELDITAKLDGIDFGATGLTEIYQNVQTILVTALGSVPLDRQLGINTDMLDSPTPAAKAKLTAEIIAAIHKDEPRVQVTRVTYTGDGQEGKLVPKVRVKIRNA